MGKNKEVKSKETESQKSKITNLSTTNDHDATVKKEVEPVGLVEKLRKNFLIVLVSLFFLLSLLIRLKFQPVDVLGLISGAVFRNERFTIGLPFIVNLFYFLMLLISIILLGLSTVIDLPSGLSGRLGKNKFNVVPLLIGIILLFITQTRDVYFLSIWGSYYLLAILVSNKLINIQKAIIIALVLTAIVFRVYPALPNCNSEGKRCVGRGYLLSFDDPFYYYKWVDYIHVYGHLPKYDPYTYPGKPETTPFQFSPYFVAYMAQVLGFNTHDAIVMYPILAAIIATIIMFFLVSELANDWKSGFLAGLFFATSPSVLTKSVAGATEEDILGMMFLLLVLYLFIKALKQTEFKKTLIYAGLSSVSFMVLKLTWGGGVDLAFLPMTAFVALFAVSALVLRFNLLNLLRTYGVITVLLIIFLFIYDGSPPMFFMILFFSIVALTISLDSILVHFFGLRYYQTDGSDKTGHLKEDSSDNTGSISSFVDRMRLKLANYLHIWIPVAFILFIIIGFIPIMNFVQSAISSVGLRDPTQVVKQTIQEQGSLSSRSPIDSLINPGYGRFGISTLLGGFFVIWIIPLLILIYLYKGNRKSAIPATRAYIFSMVYFVLIMLTVWGEARLSFGGSIGFIFIGSIIGLILPGNMKELLGWRIIPFIILIVVIPLSIYSPLTPAFAFGQTKFGSGVTPDWFEAVLWMRDDANIPKDDYVLTWWDYGHAITAISHKTVVTDPLHSREDYILETARFFYNYTNEVKALNWIRQQLWGKDERVKWIVIDKSLVDKASAMAFIGVNYYEKTDENGNFVRDENGSKIKVFNPSEGKIVNPLIRKPGDPVYGQYFLVQRGRAVCSTGQRDASGRLIADIKYMTSDELDKRPLIEIENGKKVVVAKRQLFWGFSGLPYADGKNYAGLFIRSYTDDKGQLTRQKLSLLTMDASGKCSETVLNKDIFGKVTTGVDDSIIIDLDGGDELIRIDASEWVHVPKKWKGYMFPEIYFKNAVNLKHIKFVKRFGPIRYQRNSFIHFSDVRIYHVDYDNLSGRTADVSSEVVSEASGDRNTTAKATDDKKGRQESGESSAKTTEPKDTSETEPKDTTGTEPKEINQKSRVVKVGDHVRVHYTGTLVDGTVFDSSRDRGEPLGVYVGPEDDNPNDPYLKVITGFWEALVGMKVGEQKRVEIPPEKAYGLVEDSNLMEVPKTLLKRAGYDTSVNSEVVVNDQRLRVFKELNNSVMVGQILTGETLIFDLELVSIDTNDI